MAKYLGWLCLEINQSHENMADGHWSVPRYDRLLQRLLLLQADEKKVWQVAYFHVSGDAGLKVMRQMGGRPYQMLYQPEYHEERAQPYVRYDGPINYDPFAVPVSAGPVAESRIAVDEPQTYVEPVADSRWHRLMERCFTGRWPDGA